MARDTESDRALIEAALGHHGLQPDGWMEEPSDGSLVARLGFWVVIDDEETRQEQEARGLYPNDQGELTAQAVGAVERGNQRVVFTFTPEGYDPMSGPEVVPFEDIEPAVSFATD